MKSPIGSVSGFVIDSPGIYSIVRRFDGPPTTYDKSKFIKQGRLDNKLYLFDTDNIACEAAVVPNLTKLGELDRNFFLVCNRDAWLEHFYSTMDQINNISYVELYGTNT